MKTFNDLVFGAHPSPFFGGKRAELNFDNKYGVSVITGGGAYATEDKTYELAVLKYDKITYSTNITNDVLGHQTPEEVTEIMKRIQELNENSL